MNAGYDAKGLDMGVGDYSFSPDVRQREIMRELGYLSGRQEQAEEDRIAAFGAIRRAAEIMRWHERKAEELRYMNPHGLNAAEAAAIRRAIRAAIGSLKS